MSNRGAKDTIKLGETPKGQLDPISRLYGGGVRGLGLGFGGGGWDSPFFLGGWLGSGLGLGSARVAYVSRGLRPNLLILNKGDTTSWFSSNRGRLGISSCASIHQDAPTKEETPDSPHRIAYLLNWHTFKEGEATTETSELPWPLDGPVIRDEDRGDWTRANRFAWIHLQRKSNDSAGLLQNGKPAHNQKWPKNGWRNGRQPFLGGGPKMAEKWPGKWPDMHKITKF